jgi:hypothetical protein
MPVSVEMFPQPTDVDTYVLVHLHDAEIVESLLSDADQWMRDDDWGLYARWCDGVAAEILRAGRSAGRRILLSDDDTTAPYWTADNGWTVGGDELADWEVVYLQPHELGRIAEYIPATSSVFIGGYHRADCVRRVERRLSGHGCSVTRHDTATLPLSRAALNALAERTAA